MLANQTIAFLVIRIFALCWLVKGVAELAALALTVLRYAEPSALWNAGIALTYLVFGIVLWLLAGLISRLLLKGHQGEVSVEGLSREDVYAGGFVIVGVYFFLSEIGFVLNWLHYFATQGAEAGFREAVKSGEVYDLYYPVLTMIIALILIFTGPTWARKLERRRMPEKE